MTFHCQCCDYKTTNKYDYNRHLSSKKHKEKLVEFGSSVDLMEMMKLMRFEVDVLKEENVDLKKEIKMLKENSEHMMSLLNNQTSGNNNTNVTGNNNNVVFHTHVHVSLNKYGAETYPDDMKALTNAVKGVNKAIPNLVKLRHFDNRHPENQNIMIPNKKQNKIKIYDGTRWITEDKKLTIEEKLQDFTNFMDTDEGQEIYNGCSLMIREKLDTLMNFCDKVHSGDKLNRIEQRELKRITGDVENIILDHQKK